ncbi:MAG: cation:proton antiporter [Burkholderiaceae bacterium]|nr:cation:proton antiporter [Burkholderiaceae bacterium]
MNPAEAIPAWAALPAAALLILAGCLFLVGGLGLLRLGNFYQRTHATALINTLGAGSVLIASMLYFSALQSRPVVHELLITVFVLLTAPVTAILLMRAAIHRDRRSARPEVPAHPGMAAGAERTGAHEDQEAGGL